MRMSTMVTYTLDSCTNARTHWYTVVANQNESGGDERSRLTESPTNPIAYPADTPVIPHASPAARWMNPAASV